MFEIFWVRPIYKPSLEPKASNPHLHFVSFHFFLVYFVSFRFAKKAGGIRVVRFLNMFNFSTHVTDSDS